MAWWRGLWGRFGRHHNKSDGCVRVAVQLDGHRDVLPGKPMIVVPERRHKGVASHMRKRKRAEISAKLERLSEHRPFFTYYAMATQAVITAVMLAVYGIGPISFSSATVTGQVTDRTGQVVTVQRNHTPNFFIGACRGVSTM